jgi:hypothetical protein
MTTDTYKPSQPVYLKRLERDTCTLDIVDSIPGLINLNNLSVFKVKLLIEAPYMSA